MRENRKKGEITMEKKMKIAETEREWWAILKSKDTTFVRSIDDWYKAIADKDNNPLKDCDVKSIEHFTKSLKFRNGGLGHADYSEIGKQLNYFQFKGLWARFGLGMGLFADHEGFACTSRATCSKAINSICTSNC
jgi:hypothetical protein